MARYEQEEMAQFAALSVLVKDAGFMRKFIKEALLQVGVGWLGGWVGCCGGKYFKEALVQVGG